MGVVFFLYLLLLLSRYLFVHAEYAGELSANPFGGGESSEVFTR
jgi:hypothetical protein